MATDNLHWEGKEDNATRHRGGKVDPEYLASIPDPTRIVKPRPKPRSADGGPPESGEDRPWGSDKCVLMRSYRPGFDEESQYQVFTRTKPFPIDKLRFIEKHVAYQTLLRKAPAGEIHEHYKLHLSRLEPIRETIAVLSKRLQGYRPQKYLDLKEARENDMSIDEIEKLEEGFRAYKRLVKERDKMRAHERAVSRLLVGCEKRGKRVRGFEKVNWQTGQDEDDGDGAEEAVVKE